MNRINRPPSAESIRAAIAEAKERKHNAGEQFIARFIEHLDKLLCDPDEFTAHTYYSEDLRGAMYDTNANPDFFIGYVQTRLNPLGYRVEKSHDGVGMYSTIVVRWDISSGVKRYG